MKLYQMIDVKKLKFAARKLKMLSVPDKIRIIDLLRENGGLTQTEIITKLNSYQARTSKNLMAMCNCNILNYEIYKKYKSYSINETAVEEIIRISEELYKKI
jgi:predicted transcriptional regulator